MALLGKRSQEKEIEEMVNLTICQNRPIRYHTYTAHREMNRSEILEFDTSFIQNIQ